MCFAQKTVADLKPVHAIALEEFLSKNKDYQFLSEKSIDADYLKYMRQGLGKLLTPYYKVADFNRDGIIDFALILSKKGNPKKDETVTSEEHSYVYPLAVVIFNGNKKRRFKKAFIEDLEEPLVCFLNLTNEKKKRLYFGVYETHAGFIMTPVGKGYIVEYDDEP
jgi:hypothetical protein